MTKRPTDHLEPAPKKRSGDRQISREEPPSDDDEEQVCKAHNSLRMHLSLACVLIGALSNITGETVPTNIASSLLMMKGVSALCEAGPGLSQFLALGGDLHTCSDRCC